MSSPELTKQPKVRVTGVLIEDGQILILRQNVTESLSRNWSLPGGSLEWGETIRDGLVREMKEETGLDITVGELLYICDRIQDNRHVVHLTFQIKRSGGNLTLGSEPEQTANPITDIRMIPLEELQRYGFTEKFQQLTLNGFPSRGTYQSAIANIGL